MRIGKHEKFKLDIHFKMGKQGNTQPSAVSSLVHVRPEYSLLLF